MKKLILFALMAVMLLVDLRIFGIATNIPPVDRTIASLMSVLGVSGEETGP